MNLKHRRSPRLDKYFEKSYRIKGYWKCNGNYFLSLHAYMTTCILSEINFIKMIPINTRILFL